MTSGRITGLCGRLRCCLAFEHPLYKSFRDRAPRVGPQGRDPGGVGLVTGYTVARGHLHGRARRRSRARRDPDRRLPGARGAAAPGGSGARRSPWPAREPRRQGSRRSHPAASGSPRPRACRARRSGSARWRPGAPPRGRGPRSPRPPCGARPGPRSRRTSRSKRRRLRPACPAAGSSRGTRHPVERVLEPPRDGRVVLRGREENGVRAGDRGTESRHGRRPVADVVVLVIGRYRLQARRRARARRPRPRARRQPARSPVLYEASRRLPEMPRTFTLVTSLDELELAVDRDVVRERRLAGRQRHVPVDAEGGPVDRRARASGRAARCRRRRSWGSESVPESETGFVNALHLDLAASGHRLAVERDVLARRSRSSGWRSASKKSGDWRCAARFSSLTSTLATFARRPVAPCLPHRSRAWPRPRGTCRGGSGQVSDLELGRRVNRVELPGSGRRGGQGVGGGHSCPSCSVVYY